MKLFDGFLPKLFKKDSRIRPAIYPCISLAPVILQNPLKPVIIKRPSAQQTITERPRWKDTKVPSCLMDRYSASALRMTIFEGRSENRRSSAETPFCLTGGLREQRVSSHSICLSRIIAFEDPAYAIRGMVCRSPSLPGPVLTNAERKQIA